MLVRREQGLDEAKRAERDALADFAESLNLEMKPKP
jgi:hypothetical protein